MNVCNFILSLLFQRYIDRLYIFVYTFGIIRFGGKELSACLAQSKGSVYLTNTIPGVEDIAVNNRQKSLPSRSLRSSRKNQTIKNGI